MKPNPRDRYADPADFLRALHAVGPLASTRLPDVAPPRTVATAPGPRIENAEQDGPRSGNSLEGRAHRGLGRWMDKRAPRPAVVIAELLSKWLDELIDDSLTMEGEDSFLNYMASLGVESLDAYPAIQQRLIIVRANDGRLPVVEASAAHCSLRTGEILYIEAACGRLTTASAGAIGGAGVAFPVVRGGRYRPQPGELAELGPKVSVAESGILSVTSHHVVFSGQTEFEESLYTRLVFVRIFVDGLGISVENRQHIGTYRLLNTSGEVVAAVINAAAQRMF